MSEDKPAVEQSPFQPSQQSQQQSAMEGASRQAGYDIPVESVLLPSKGAIYPHDHPLANEPTVEIKCMTAHEENILSSPALMKNGTVITKLLESCILNKTVDPDDLLIGDRNAVLIAIRITGYGAEYGAKVTCPECDESFDHEFSLNGLKVKGLGAEPLQPNANLFKFFLPRSKKEVFFKLLTGKEEAEISLISKRRKKMGDQISSSVTDRLLYSIVSVGGDSDSTKIANFVKFMPASDSMALRKYMDKIEPEVKMKQFAKCTKCGEESEVVVPLGMSFFWPDAGQ